MKIWMSIGVRKCDHQMFGAVGYTRSNAESILYEDIIADVENNDPHGRMDTLQKIRDKIESDYVIFTIERLLT